MVSFNIDDKYISALNAWNANKYNEIQMKYLNIDKNDRDIKFNNEVNNIIIPPLKEILNADK